MCLIKLLFFFVLCSGIVALALQGAHEFGLGGVDFAGGLSPSPDTRQAAGGPDPTVPTEALPWAHRASEAAVGVTTFEAFYDLMLPGVELARGRRAAGPGRDAVETFFVSWTFADGSFIGAGFVPAPAGLVLRRLSADPVTLSQRR